MRKTNIVVVLLSIVTMLPFVAWIALYLKGRQFALRDRLRKADAIVILAGTRGNIGFLNGKICTAAHLYKQGWASYIICAGKFSVKVTEQATLIPIEELQMAVTNGRIQEKDVAKAAKSWDIGLGARYMREQLLQMGVPADAILLEDASLHTRENAEEVLTLIQQHNMKRIILVTSPFHQLRTYLTFAKVFQPYNIQVINYYAETGEWNPYTWFLSKEHRNLVKSETERIKQYRQKGDLL